MIKIGTKTTLSKILKQKARAQKAAQNALKKAQEAKALEEKLALEKAEEAKLQEITQRIAKSIIDPMRKVTVQVSGDITDFSAEKLIHKHQGDMLSSDSIWAPWSACFRKK